MNKEKFFYLRKIETNDPVGVVAIRVTGKTLCVGVSLCSKHDQFNKKTGHIKAVGRSRSKVEGTETPVASPLCLAHIMDAHSLPFNKMGVDILRAQATYENLIHIMTRPPKEGVTHE